MDKSTLSNYGWIVIAVLVLSVMIALATPFGKYVQTTTENTLTGLIDVSDNALGVVNMSAKGDNSEGGANAPVTPTPCTHTNTKTEGKVDATCTEAGHTGKTVCADCGEIISNGTTISATGHTTDSGICDNCGVKIIPPQLTTLTAKTWKNLTSFNGSEIWTDGTNIYYSATNGKCVLNGNVWATKIWNINILGSMVWTDGTNIYYSSTSNAGKTGNYILNGDTWEEKTWSGLTSFDGMCIWTNGTNIFYSNGNKQYILRGNTWYTKTWSGITNPNGSNIWTDGTNYYYSSGTKQYILNGDTWVKKTWNGLTSFDGSCVWTDGTNIYYSSGTTQYVLNGDTWEPKTWNGLASFFGNQIWTDGTNYYYSYNGNQYILS